MKSLILTAILLAVSFTATTGFCDTKPGEKIDGKKEFEKHCAKCHPNKENIAKQIPTVKVIIERMRKPGPGMTSFDKKTISDKEATVIAEYILAPAK